MRPQVSNADRVIARIASGSHGVATHSELLEIGVTPAEIKVRMRRGTLIRVHRGVYRVGHTAPSTEATYLAAVRAAGDGAVLSGRAAAHLLLLIRHAHPPAPEISAARDRSIQGVRCRRRSFARRDTTTVRGIPVTTPELTLVDLAGELSGDELVRAVHQASVIHRVRPEHVEAVLARRANAPGSRKLRAILRGDERITLSRLERLFLARLREAKLELPQTNERVGRRYVDCRWPARRLTVELDSYTYHASRHAWEQDRAREREAYARGDQLRRYTWDDVAEDPRRMLGELRPLLT